MQVLILNAAAVVHATNTYAIRGARLRHTAGATCTIKDGGGRVVIDLVTVAGDLKDTMMFPAPLYLTGLEVATISAGTLYLYLD